MSKHGVRGYVWPSATGVSHRKTARKNQCRIAGNPILWQLYGEYTRQCPPQVARTNSGFSQPRLVSWHTHFRPETEDIISQVQNCLFWKWVKVGSIGFKIHWIWWNHDLLRHLLVPHASWPQVGSAAGGSRCWGLWDRRVHLGWVSSGKHTKHELAWPFCSLIYLLSMVMFHSYACLQEGTWCASRLTRFKPIHHRGIIWLLIK